jgi:hypothetical protein
MSGTAADDGDHRGDTTAGGGAPDGDEDGTGTANRRIDLEEYKIASAEARYRDRMLFTSFYLSLVALAVLLQVALGLFDQQRYRAIAVVSVVAATGFAILLWWSYATTRVRNKAWGRRTDIEDGVGRVELNHYLSSDTRYDFAENELVDSDGTLGRSSSDLVLGFAAAATLGWIGTAGGSVGVLLFGADAGVDAFVGYFFGSTLAVVFLSWVVHVGLSS